MPKILNDRKSSKNSLNDQHKNSSEVYSFRNAQKGSLIIKCNEYNECYCVKQSCAVGWESLHKLWFKCLLSTAHIFRLVSCKRVVNNNRPNDQYFNPIKSSTLSLTQIIYQLEEHANFTVKKLYRLIDCTTITYRYLLVESVGWYLTTFVLIVG